MIPVLFLAQPLTADARDAALRLADALALRPEFAVVMAWGAPDPPQPAGAGAGVEVVPLPPAGALIGRWIVGPDGQPVDHAWKKRRAAASLAVSARVRPGILILDGPALTGGAFGFELRPLVGIAQRRDPRPLIAATDPGSGPGVAPAPDLWLAPDPIRAAAMAADARRTGDGASARRG